MMQINKLFCFLLFFILPIISSAQDTNSFISDYSDSSEYRIIIKTQELLDGKYVTLDVFTIKAYKDSTKVYYVRYGDMLISSLIMQYSILERMIAFETNVNSLACQDDAVCTNRILFEGASNSYSVPIDLLNEELISNLMLELEK